MLATGGELTKITICYKNCDKLLLLYALLSAASWLAFLKSAFELSRDFWTSYMGGPLTTPHFQDVGSLLAAFNQ
jgi:hypothetical protein